MTISSGSGTLPAVRGIERLEPAARRELLVLAARQDLDADFLVAVMSFETGGSFDPAQKNFAGSGATGLIQFMPQMAILLGTTTTDLAKMTQVEQLAYVETYFSRFKIRRDSLEDHYLAVLAGRTGKSGSDIVFAAPTKAYEANKGLDADQDGIVTAAEAVAQVRAILTAAEDRPRVVVGGDAQPGGRRRFSPIVPALALVAGVAVLRRRRKSA